MVRFKDLSYGLGQLLHKVETEKDYEEFRFIINTLKPNVIRESIKEGYFSRVSQELVDDSRVKMLYHQKLVKLKLRHIKKGNITNENFFEYQGKIVHIKSKYLEVWGASEFNAKVLTVSFNEPRREFQVVLDVMREDSSKIMISGYGMYESYIESITVVE